MTLDRARGALLGTAVGDALGMPIEGFSHINVRTYYKGIKEYRDDEKREDLRAGQWTDDAQMTFAVARAMTKASPDTWPQRVAEEYVALRPEARRWGPSTTTAIDALADGAAPEEAGSDERPTNGAAMRAAPLGLWWALSGVERKEAWAAIRPVLAVTHRHPASLAAGWGQVAAVRHAFAAERFDRDAFWQDLVEQTRWAEAHLGAEDDRCSRRLDTLSSELDSWPLDLLDLTDGNGVAADEAWPFACAMFARQPRLVDATLLSSVNVGGDADTVGAMVGALLGALNGWSAMPQEWRDGLEAADDLQRQADALFEVWS